MQIIGIDPGASGGIAVIDAGAVRAVKMPATEADLRDWLLSETAAPRFVWLEQVGSMPGQGVSSTFKFGQSYGFLRGLLVGLGIPHEFVRPAVWQRALGCLSGGDKNVTKAAAQRLWPHVKWTHATADAALIAEYGRREMVRTGRA